VTDAARFKRIAPYVIVCAGAGYLYYVAAHFEYHRRAGVLGPDAWPKLVLGMLVVICLYEVVRRLLPGHRDEGAPGVLEDMVESSAEAHGETGAPAVQESHPGLLAVGIALTAIYVAAIQTLGFFLATVIYVAAFIVLGGYRRWKTVAAVSVIGTLLLVFFFMKVVYVSLPIGREPFAQVTLLLMQLLGIR